MRKKPQRRGFTLIEMLVVLVIISIVTSVALLSLGRSKGRSITAAAYEIADCLRLAQEKALTESKVLKIEVNPEGMQFFRYAGDALEQPAWVPLNDRLLTTYSWPSGIAVWPQGDETETFITIIISSSGELSPFILNIGETTSMARLQIIGEAGGAITIKKNN